MSLFSPPAGGGDVVKPETLQNHLLIIRPIDFKSGFPTTYGATDAVSADVADLSEAGPDGQPKVYKGAMFFNVMLVSGLKSEIGKLVLAVMVQGVAKPGQSAPWQLQDATQDQASVAAATAYLNAHPEFQALAPPPPIRPTAAVPPVVLPTTPTQPTPVPAPPVTPVVPATPAAPAMTSTQVPGGGTSTITPETLALIARMQATGDLTTTNTAHG